MEFIIISIIVLCATIIGGITGIGGGIIIKPFVEAYTAYPIASINFLSGCTVLAMASTSLLKSKRCGVVIQWRISSLIAVGAILGGFIGKQFFDYCLDISGSSNLIGTIQAFMIISITVIVFIYVRFKNKIITKRIKNPVLCVSVGVFLGALSAFLGIGGGPINIAVLLYLFSMDTKTCTVNSIYIIFFSQLASLVLTLISGNIPFFPPFLLIMMIITGITGGIVSAQILKKLINRTVDNLFCIVLAVIIMISIYNVINYLN